MNFSQGHNNRRICPVRSKWALSALVIVIAGAAMTVRAIPKVS